MSTRLKVLISAYACEPGKGSEPEVGWQWALQMARFHDVTVLTRANNQPVIEPALERLRGKQPLPNFVYHDRGTFLLDMKRRTKAIRLYYLLWQRSAREVVAQLLQAHQFDLLHHVTFAGFRYPTAIWGHGVPCVWGPIGGIESIPRALLPWHHPASLMHELSRNANNLLQSTPFYVLPKRARATTLVLVSTPEMRQTFARLGFQTQLMPTIGLKTKEVPFRPHRVSEGPLKILFVGNLITLKGVDLALEALKASQTNATFTLFGSGNYAAPAQRQAKRLGLTDRVFFRGRLPRDEVLKVYPDFDLFLFPSLHDTGGYAVIEAMFNELPIICLDFGGPGVAVQAGCGVKVPLGSRKEVVARLAAAIRFYDENRGAIAEQGRKAREAVLRQYDWDRKGEQMNPVYEEAVAGATSQGKSIRVRPEYTGMGRITDLLHKMVSFRGALAGVLGLLLIGALGFMSLSLLKSETRRIVNDTLPGLSSAAAANANLGQAFTRTVLFITEANGDQRTRLRGEIDEFTRKTTVYLREYEKQINSPEDRARLEALLQRRDEYLKIREKTMELAENSKSQEAIAVCNNELLPAYYRYCEVGEELFQYNVAEGKSRSGRIMLVCTITQFFVATVGIGVFVMGFFIGLFK